MSPFNPQPDVVAPDVQPSGSLPDSAAGLKTSTILR